MLFFQYLCYTFRICLFFFAEEIDCCSSHQRTEYFPNGIIKRNAGNTGLQRVLYVRIEGFMADFYQITQSGMSNWYAFGFAGCARGVDDVGNG